MNFKKNNEYKDLNKKMVYITILRTHHKNGKYLKWGEKWETDMDFRNERWP